MKRLLILLFTVFAFSCKHSNSVGEPNPEAEKLNNLAVNSLYSSSNLTFDQKLKNSIQLLDRAIKIDNKYFTAYLNKFTFQNDLKAYSGALLTSKQMIKIWPNNTFIKIEAGMVCEKVGDTICSKQYYKCALAICGNDLKKTNISREYCRQTEENKGVALILLNQPQQGYIILKNLYAKETDAKYKQHLLMLVNMTRGELVYGVEDTTISF